MISRALLVGINRYRVQDGGFADLQGCLNDVELMKSTLQAVFSCPPNKMKILLDEEATFENVLAGLANWTNNLRTGERLFLFYSGHGTRVPDVDGDEDSGMDEAMVTHDFSKSRPLLDDIFHYHFARIPEGVRATVVFDCCHSGGLPRAPLSTGQTTEDYGQVRGGEPIPRSEYSPPELAELSELKKSFAVETVEDRILVLAACQRWQQAWEKKVGEKRQGLFTYSICETLRNRGPQLSAKDAIDYAYRAIQTLGFDQTPRLIGREEFFSTPLFGEISRGV